MRKRLLVKFLHKCVRFFFFHFKHHLFSFIFRFQSCFSDLICQSRKTRKNFLSQILGKCEKCIFLQMYMKCLCRCTSDFLFETLSSHFSSQKTKLKKQLFMLYILKDVHFIWNFLQRCVRFLFLIMISATFFQLFK